MLAALGTLLLSARIPRGHPLIWCGRRLPTTTLAALATSLFLSATALRLAHLATLGDARLLVEAAALELAADTFAADFALEAIQGAIDVVVSDFDFEWSQFVSGHGCFSS
jgi:hypothetical protein